MYISHLNSMAMLMPEHLLSAWRMFLHVTINDILRITSASQIFIISLSSPSSYSSYPLTQ